MSRNRILALSAFVLVASGAILFACSSGDDGFNDGGADAKADQTSNKDSGSDAAKDGSLFGGDGGQDATVQDAGSDATASDATTTDATTTDATTTDAAGDGASADATDDGASTDGGSMDAGAVTTFMVLRVGGDVDAGGDASLTTGGAIQVFLEERNISDGALVRTIALPTAPSGNNQPLTEADNATSEGSLTRSADGHWVVLAGYAAAPGTASVKTTAADAGTPRVVARVDKNGNVDTSTEVLAYSKNNIRGAASTDGTGFWLSGSGPEGTPYAAYASTGAFTNLSTTPTNTRVAQVFGGQVYVSSGSGAFHGISAVGTGTPTTSGQTTTLLPGMPGDAGSPYGFSMLDLDGAVSGLDTLYVADDTGTTAGIQKWVFDGNTWTKIATFTDQSTSGFRGLTAYFDGTNVVLIGTTGDNTSIVKYVDDGKNLTPAGTLLATAAAGTAFRGVALSPE